MAGETAPYIAAAVSPAEAFSCSREPTNALPSVYIVVVCG